MVVVIIIMGAAGAGKTTIGRALAAALGWPFVDADDLHPAHNIEKMRAGVPLGDADRAPWIGTLRAIVERAIDRREHTVVACSAVKERDRHTLRDQLRSVRFVYLRADREEPGDALIVDAASPPQQILAAIRREFGV